MELSSVTILISLLAALVIAGLGYVVLGRKIETHDRASRRMANVSRQPAGRAARKEAVDTGQQRRKNIQDSIREDELKKSKARKSLRARVESAGLTISVQTFYIYSAVCGVVLAVVIFIVAKSPLVAVVGGLVGFLGFPRWLLGFLTKRREKAFIEEFANALDVIVRGVKSGLPINECLKVIANESPAPVGPEFAELVEAQRLGVPLEQGLQKMYERMAVPEVNFFQIVLAIQSKSGGNLSEALGNLARVLRDRKKMRAKIQAMSSEAKASAGIIGSLPFVVMGAVSLTTPSYLAVLFHEPVGHVMLICGGLWMLTGVLVMKKMINFNF